MNISWFLMGLTVSLYGLYWAHKGYRELDPLSFVFGGICILIGTAGILGAWYYVRLLTGDTL